MKTHKHRLCLVLLILGVSAILLVISPSGQGLWHEIAFRVSYYCYADVEDDPYFIGRNPKVFLIHPGWSKAKVVQTLGVPLCTRNSSQPGAAQEWEYKFPLWRGNYLIRFDSAGQVASTTCGYS